ncbi:DISARM system phospholipase D-like protein DrmC [Hydrogenimonas sp.]
MVRRLVEIASRHSTDRILLLADRLERVSNLGEFRGSLGELDAWIGIDDRRAIEYLCEEDGAVSGEVCAAVLRGAVEATRRNTNAERTTLVWTGPSTILVPTRRTEEVLLEVIEAAESRLFLVSYVAHRIDGVLEALERAMKKGVKVEVLMESTSEYGGRISMDSIELFRERLPEAVVYWWNEPGASVHAKCAVADGEVAFITSANLTEAAMRRNMELGVKVEGGDLPKRLHDHLDALVVTGKIERVE